MSLAGALLLAAALRPLGTVAEPLPVGPQGLDDTAGHDQLVEPERTRYDQIRRDIERAGRAGDLGALRNLVLDIDRELEEPAPLPVTACWQHLKATALVELDRHEEAKTTFKLLADTCPTWEVLNNLAVLEAVDSRYGPARDKLRNAIDRALAAEKTLPRNNLNALLSEDEDPFLILAGFIEECTATPIPQADCEGRLLLTATLEEGGDPIPATYLVFEEADALGDRKLATDSVDPVSRFEVALPEGGYVVSATVGMASVQREVTVSAGATTAMRLALGAGRLAASWRLAPTGDKLPARFRITRDGDVAADSQAPTMDFTAILPAGTYQVRAEDGPLGSEQEQRIFAGDESHVALDAGVAEALEAWRRAWQDLDADEFIFSFADDFTPDPDTSHSDWVADRQEKIGNKESIDITIGDVQYTRVAPDSVAARFTQRYEACFKDPPGRAVCDAGIKTLTFRRAGGDWEIVGQEFEQTDSGCDGFSCR